MGIEESEIPDILVADVPLDNIIISVMDFYDFLNYMYNEFPNFYEFEKNG